MNKVVLYCIVLYCIAHIGHSKPYDTILSFWDSGLRNVLLVLRREITFGVAGQQTTIKTIVSTTSQDIECSAELQHILEKQNQVDQILHTLLNLTQPTEKQ